MSYRLVFGERAIADLDELVIQIATQADDPSAGLALLRRIVRHCERLAALPAILGTRRPLFGPDLRSSPDGAYLIFFRYRDDVLEIVTIVDGRRDLAAYFLARDGSAPE